jgi:hypothetical protein
MQLESRKYINKNIKRFGYTFTKFKKLESNSLGKYITLCLFVYKLNNKLMAKETYEIQKIK